MIRFGLPREARVVLCIGAHSDDIEIGCGGALLTLVEARPDLEFHWVVLSARGEREREARDSAARFLEGAASHHIVVEAFRDAYFPYLGSEIKGFFDELQSQVSPDLIFTHFRRDRHQDHRLVSDLTWNTFRNHLILEYEVPKYDGDLGAPNLYVPLASPQVETKLRYLMSGFPSQHAKR